MGLNEKEVKYLFEALGRIKIATSWKRPKLFGARPLLYPSCLDPALGGYGLCRVGKRVIGKEMEPDVRVTASIAEAS